MELSVPGRWRWLLFGSLTLLAVLEFSARGPVRALGWESRDFNDFLSPYVQARIWSSGRDPYSPPLLAEMWPVSSPPPFLLPESADGRLPAKRGLPSPYLTTAFPLILPIAELPWKAALWVWDFLCVAAVFVVAWVLIEMAGAGRRSPMVLLILLSALLLAPVQTAIAASNIVTVVFALGMLAVLCADRNQSRMAGVLLVLAAGLKPTVALPFVIYALVKPNRGRVITAAVVTGIVLLGLTAIPNPGAFWWWQSFLQNSRSMFAPGAIDDFSTANPLRFQLVNLQAALSPLLQNRTYTQIATWAILILLLGLWFRAVRRDQRIGLLDLALLATASLLPLYHRFTDAGLLLVPVAWALIAMAGELRIFAAGCLVLAVPFLVPGAAMLYEFSQRPGVLQQLSRTEVWDLFILPHQAWLILMICVLLLVARMWTPHANAVQLARKAAS